MNIYKVAIIGCGSIGAMKPDHIDSPLTANILTHAHAVYHHPQTELSALVDKDSEKLHAALNRWRPIQGFSSIDQLEIEPNKFDIIIVAVPTELHHSTLSFIGKYINPKLVIAEKPFCNHLEEAEEIDKIFKDRKIPIMVNYIRRFTQGHQEIKKIIDEEKFGKVQNCRVIYTRGMKRDGCHFLDILRYFFGECYSKEISPAHGLDDYSEFDKTYSGYLDFEKCDNVFFQACDGRKYGIFEIDICFEDARIRIIDNGLYYERYPVTQENEWGHKSLSYKLTEVFRQETNLNFGMYNLINNAVNYLEGKEKLLCTSDDAIAVHEILE